MRTISSFVIAAALAAPSLASAATWDIDPSHSSATFTVKHMMITNVRGEFRKVTGTIVLDDKEPAKSTVEATVDATTIDTREEKRDAHLKSPDFFDVAKFPTLTFKSTKVSRAGKGKWRVDGELTMHGVTHPVTLTVEGPTPEMKDPWGNTRVAFAATTKVNREDYGLKWNKVLEGGGVLVGKEVTIALDVEVIMKHTEAPTNNAAIAK
jgi:polyisoprenoid-binding protein YceI